MMDERTKIRISSELLYFISILMLSFAVAMMSAANLGLSMIASPAYILSQKVSFLTFGQSEYVIQTLLLIIFCIAIKQFKLVYLSSYVTCILYGAALDLWRLIIPEFNPDITAPGSMAIYIRIIYFLLGMMLTAMAISLCFRTYLYPQVYDFFVKGISEKFELNRTKVKIIFDASFLAISIVLSLVLFRKFVGISYGTVVITAFNGLLISFFGKLFDKFFVSEPTQKKFADRFDI